jgi:hypothetical protein
LNIIEYLFCERLFGKVFLIEKSAEKKCNRKIVAEKVRQENSDRKGVTEKSWQKKCDRKITAEKVRQKNRGRKSAATTWLGSIYDRYGTSCLRYVL